MNRDIVLDNALEHCIADLSIALYNVPVYLWNVRSTLRDIRASVISALGNYLSDDHNVLVNKYANEKVQKECIAYAVFDDYRCYINRARIACRSAQIVAQCSGAYPRTDWAIVLNGMGNVLMNIMLDSGKTQQL